MLLPSYFDLHRIEANAVFGHLFKMTSPLTDHAIEKHVNCQQLGTLLIHSNAIGIISLECWMCSEESTHRLNLDEYVYHERAAVHIAQRLNYNENKCTYRLKIAA